MVNNSYKRYTAIVESKLITLMLTVAQRGYQVRTSQRSRLRWTKQIDAPCVRIHTGWWAALTAFRSIVTENRLSTLPDKFHMATKLNCNSSAMFAYVHCVMFTLANRQLKSTPEVWRWGPSRSTKYGIRAIWVFCRDIRS